MTDTPSLAYALRPWTDVVRPTPDVASGDLALGTYAANLASVALGGGGAGVSRCTGVLRRHLLHAHDG